MNRMPRDVDMPAQLPLELPHKVSFGEDDFFVSSSNERAFALIEAWPDWGTGTQVILGPPGSGKSHLATIWSGVSQALEVHGPTLSPDKVLSFHDARAIVIEDAPGPSLDENAMFHLLNLARETGASLLITTEVLPASWNVQLPDLATRLRALPVTPIAAPDEALLRAVLVKLFSDRQVAVDELLVSYILSRTERSLGALRETVEYLDRTALAEKAALSRNFASKVLRRRGDVHDDDGVSD